MRRRHEGNSSAGRQFIRAQPVTIHGDREQPGAGGTENLTRALIAWFLNHDGLTAFDEYSNDQIQSLL
jgi:hypothetical protein